MHRDAKTDLRGLPVGGDAEIGDHGGYDGALSFEGEPGRV